MLSFKVQWEDVSLSQPILISVNWKKKQKHFSLFCTMFIWLSNCFCMVLQYCHCSCICHYFTRTFMLYPC